MCKNLNKDKYGLNVLAFGVANGTILIATTKCDIYTFKIQDLNEEKLVFSRYVPLRMDQIWYNLLIEKQFTAIIESFENSFIVTYNNEELLFLLGKTEGIKFSLRSYNVNLLSNVFINDSVRAISHWDTQTFALWSNENLVICKMSPNDPTMIEVYKVIKLCMDIFNNIYSLASNVCTYRAFDGDIKQGFITEYKVYLFGFSPNHTGHMVYIFDSDVLHQIDSKPLTIKYAMDFLIEPMNYANSVKTPMSR